MAFGLEIRTTAGVVNSANLRAARAIHSETLTGGSGTISVPAFDSDAGFIHSKGGFYLVFSFDNTTKILTVSNPYGNPSPPPVTFNFLMFS